MYFSLNKWVHPAPSTSGFLQTLYTNSIYNRDPLGCLEYSLVGARPRNHTADKRDVNGQVSGVVPHRDRVKVR